MMILRELLLEYKETSLDLLKAAEEDNIDAIDMLLVKRKNVIERINSLEYKKEDFINISNELNLIKIENSISNILENRKKNLKLEINNISKQKDMNKSYNKGFYNNANVFSKKV